MATNKYIEVNLAAGTRAVLGAGFPGHVMWLTGTYEKLVADNDTSVLRLGKVPSNAIPIYGLSAINNDALTGATDIDIGVYKPLATGGDVVDKDILADGLNIASGNALGSPAAAFPAVSIESFGKSLKTLVDTAAGTTSYDEEYDIAITGNTFGTATGTIAWRLGFLIPQV